MKVLVTGGTGSIGHEVVRQSLLKGWHPIIFSRDESMQADMKREYPDCDYVIGDVEKMADLRYALALEPDYVVHCAAMKHVPICQKEPVKAVQTNILGTLNVLLTFAEFTKGVVVVSTDKTVEPYSTMGFTKKICELMAQDERLANNRVMVVRFGNIIPSRGSVIPLWLDAKRRGLPLKITDPEMTRYFVPIQDAVACIFAALKEGVSGETWIPRCSLVKMGDLLEVIANGTPTETIGPRPGEKRHEKLFTVEESGNMRLRAVDGIEHFVLSKNAGPGAYYYGHVQAGKNEIAKLLDRALGDTWK